MNALQLCTSALVMPLSVSEQIVFLSDIEKAAGRLIGLLQKVEAIPDAPASNNVLPQPA
jgi:hypothetical protein